MSRLTRSLSLGSTNALANFGRVVEDIGDRDVLLLLDYDGTLAPIVNDPSQAYLPHQTRDVLTELTKYCTTGIITGRSIDKVAKFVKVDTLFYAGSHGFDIRGPSSTDISHQVATEHLPRLSSLKRELEEQLDGIEGASVEDNRFSVSVHYRNVPEERLPEVFQTIDTVVSRYEQIRIGSGKKVVEFRPDISWSKGHAVLWLLEALNLRHREDVVTVYIGDDTTDEDAFKVLSHEVCRVHETCVLGIGILVTEVSKFTYASYTLRDPHEVREFLVRILEVARWRARTMEAPSPTALPGPISKVDNMPATFVLTHEDADEEEEEEKADENRERQLASAETRQHTPQSARSTYHSEQAAAQEMLNKAENDMRMERSRAAALGVSK